MAVERNVKLKVKLRKVRPTAAERERTLLEMVYHAYSTVSNGEMVTTDTLAKRFQLTRRKCDHYVKQGKAQGLFTYRGKSPKRVLVTQRGVQLFKSAVQTRSIDKPLALATLRAHNVLITQTAAHRPVEVPKGYIASKTSEKLHWDKPQLTKPLPNGTISVRQKTITYSFRDVYSVDADAAVEHCMNLAFGYSQHLEEEGFKLDRPEQAITTELAVNSMELATLMQRWTIRYKTPRVCFDASKGFGEFELIHPDFSNEDAMRVIKFLEAVAIDEVSLNDLKMVIAFVKKQTSNGVGGLP